MKLFWRRTNHHVWESEFPFIFHHLYFARRRREIFCSKTPKNAIFLARRRRKILGFGVRIRIPPLKEAGLRPALKGLSHSVHGSGVFFAKKTPGRHLNVFPSWLGVRGWGFGTVQIHINNFEKVWFFLWRAFLLLPQIVKIEAKLGRLSADNQKMLKIDFF